MSDAWQAGSTRAWRAVRAQVLARDRYRCRVRAIGICTGTGTHAHHVLGRAVTGDDPRYIVAACEPCNLHVGDPATHDPYCPACHPPQPTPRTRW